MTIHTATDPVTDAATLHQVPEPEFDLDITVIETDAGLAELMRLTDDGCGSSCESACTTTCP